MINRRVMMSGMGAVALIGISEVAAAPSRPRALGEKRLALHNVHNGERIDARWYGAHGFDAQGLAEINHGMRDWRTGEVLAIDPLLIALITDLRERLDVSARTPIDLISGYRSPATNGTLHAKSHGVATKSQHMLGKAGDIAIPGVRLDNLRTAATALKAGGVGYYPRDGFVHVDTGRVRYW